MPTASDGHIPYQLFASLSIRRKLTAMIMGVSAAALILSGVFIVISQMAVFRNNMVLDQVQQTLMIANNCRAAVVFNDTEDAAAVLRTLSIRSAMAYANVSKTDGATVAIYLRVGFEDDPQVLPADADTYAFTSHWLLTRKPIILDGETIGTVFLQSDLSDLAVFRRQVVTIVVTTLCVILLLAWAVSIQLQKLISGPIEGLTEIVRDVSRRKDYSIRAADVGRDEVGVLARAFNEMLSEVELRDRKLQDRERRTQAYLNIADVMIVVFDVDGGVRLINPKGCSILGLKEADIVGKNWFEHFVPARFRERVRSIFAALTQGRSAAMQRYEYRIETGHGEERLIAWNNSMIQDETGVYLLSSGEDITERRLAEDRELALREQLVRAERMEMIGVLAGGVAHDLNNILGPMVALPELLEEDIGVAMQGGDAIAQAQILESIGILKTSAHRAANVVRDLMVLSRRGHYKRVPADINQLLAAWVGRDAAIVRSLAECYPLVNIALRSATDVLMVLASENHLCRVVDNLIRNAVEAIDGKGTVTVTTSRQHLAKAYQGYTTVPPGDYAMIAVKDTGSGIDPDCLSHIFEPFYTRKTKTDHSGSGLGLSIVHGIVKDHDGYIDVETVMRRGTTFTLYFPLTNSCGSPQDQPDDLPLVTGKGRILVVDDEPGQRFLASSCLTRFGYTVDLAEDGHAAVKSFAEAEACGQPSPYDLVVLDMRMEPDFDGLDTLRAIRERYPAQKVLIASGHAEDDRSMEALQLGAKWLGKPYRLHDLARTVAELVQGAGAGV